MQVVHGSQPARVHFPEFLLSFSPPAQMKPVWHSPQNGWHQDNSHRSVPLVFLATGTNEASMALAAKRLAPRQLPSVSHRVEIMGSIETATKTARSILTKVLGAIGAQAGAREVESAFRTFNSSANSFGAVVVNAWHAARHIANIVRTMIACFTVP
eukprot:CAMPEP_0119343570 /NCGR_PEP_ID=MMETSP1333-20130426/106517_1 /TAXON_ID=418940 /ORGANISM="Scyphosphaera apsteinii, Strain RCC1455" /LENGTH=155 /DNA_ID=CAMNT_0007355967 /DNA_START=303 /DNA_END=771 /DNA_ORIENTATION=-